MKSTHIFFCTILILFVSQAAYTEENQDSWEIVPGIRVGLITTSTTETDLIEIYGAENVKKENIHIGEGFFSAGTIIFADHPEKKIEITWFDTENRKKPKSIYIRGDKSIWRTKEGISLGTSLKQIEELNGKPFVLYGYGWDPAGIINDFNEGILSGYCDTVQQGNRRLKKLSIRLIEPEWDYNDSAVVSKWNNEMIVKNLSSDNSFLKNLNPSISEMIVRFNE